MIKADTTNKKVIEDILLDRFRSVYCNTCAGNLDADYCGECHRKYMNWGLSENSASRIADEILEAIKKSSFDKEN